ncbi:hypothetical protein G6514_001413 [Epicoccum nigrum]|nr:hypothetical protein G6514_001413 [Epicoccum nigrum]
MDPQYDDADAFKDGIAHTLSMPTDTLTDTIDDESATTIIRFALLAVDTDAKKLGILVNTICKSTAPSSKCVAKLPIKLLELTPPNIQENITKGSDSSSDFDDTIRFLWSPHPIIIAGTLFQAGCLTNEIIGKCILGRMADSDALFVHLNYELFINTCLSCGPKLDAGTYKIDRLTAVINKAFARVLAKLSMLKLALAGLVAARNNDWIVETNTAPRVLTPETESTYEPEDANQEDLIPYV